MYRFLAFIKKEFYHIFRDRRTMLVLLGIPMFQIILFGFAITSEIKNGRLMVVNTHGDVLAEQLVEQMEGGGYFRMVEYADSPLKVEEMFRQNKIDMAMIFDEHFGNKLTHEGNAGIQLLLDASDPNTANTLNGYASMIINTYLQELQQRESFSNSVTITPRIQLLYNPQLKSAYHFVPGVMGMILMLICAMMTSISIVREKETGSMEVLLVSPVKPIWIILSKTIPYLVLSCANLITILLLSVFVLKVPIQGNLAGLIFISLVFILVALGFGLVISSVAKTQVAAMLISSMALMMPVIVLSGMIFPIENMPVFLQWISNIIPAKWYIEAVRKIMIEGVPFASVWRELSVLFGMFFILLFISIKTFKNRLS